MSKIKSLFATEPAVVAGLVGSVVAFVGHFGFHLPADTVAEVMGAYTFLSAIVVRSKVSPVS